MNWKFLNRGILFFLILFFVFSFNFLGLEKISYAQISGGIEGQITPGGNVDTPISSDKSLIGKAWNIFKDPYGTGQKLANTGKEALLEKVEDFGAGILANAVKLIAPIIDVLASVLREFAEMLVHFSVYFFNITVEITTSGFDTLIEGGTGEAIKKGWEIFRDVSNIGLVFILLYIAIRTILQIGSFPTGQLLGKVIMVALLINFSFLIGKTIVNIANNMTISMREKVESVAEKSEKDPGLAGAIYSILDKAGSQDSLLQKIDVYFDTNKTRPNTSEKRDLYTSIQSATGNIMIVILNFVIAVIFFIAGIMLITRVIVLLILLVISPIAFVSGILPQTKKMSEEWWEAIFKNAFFAPVFFLFLYVAMEMINGGILDIQAIPRGSTLTGSEDLAEVVKNIVGPLVQYGIVLGLFIAALISAQKLSVSGGQIGKLSGSITSNIGKGIMGTAGFAGRHTLGRGAQYLADSQMMQSFAARSRLGASTLKGIRGVAGSSFDARGSKTFQGVASATGFGEKGFGTVGVKDGYRGTLKDQIKARKDFAKDALGGKASDKNEYVAATKRALEIEQGVLTQATRQRAAGGGPGDKAYENMKKSVKEAEEKHKDAQKTAFQRMYAQTISRGPLPFVQGVSRADRAKGTVDDMDKRIRDYIPWSGKKNRDAAGAIMKELTKKQDQKNLDALKEALKAANP